jgi:excisionase family DNA binding protein
MPVEPIFLRPRDAAELAGLSTRAIYGAINRGELRAVRLCSRLRIPREAFDAWVASSTVRCRAPVRRPRRRSPARDRRRRRDLGRDRDSGG